MNGFLAEAEGKTSVLAKAEGSVGHWNEVKV